jgi:hypothetical protein
MPATHLDPTLAPVLRALADAAGRLALSVVAYGLGVALVSALILPAVLAPLRGTPLEPAAPSAIPVVARSMPGGAP